MAILTCVLRVNSSWITGVYHLLILTQGKGYCDLNLITISFRLILQTVN